MARGAVRWSCDRCGVSVGRMDGEPTEFPNCWTRSGGRIFCLSCSRARAGEAAIDSAPAANSPEERTRIRRRALIAFEIDRAPDAPDRAIAHSCSTSSAAVAAVRDELERSAGAASDLGNRTAV